MRRRTKTGGKAEGAFALVIVLAFVVLLTGLVVAYFSRATGQTALAAGTFGDVAADLTARSAVSSVVADFKREIVTGSNAPGASAYYEPSTSANIVPQRNVPLSSQPSIPNLIRTSKRSDPLVAPAVATQGSNINSATDPAIGGRVVSAARWNKHCLLTMADPATADVNPDPVAAFTPPDWVYLTPGGATDAPQAADVIGRYAFAVYDEGGLLDMNVAGMPSPTPAASPVGRKGNIAFADMRALPYRTGSVSFAAVGQMVGWRNNATMRIDPATWPTWANNAAGNTRFTDLFLSTSQSFIRPATAIYNGRTDQVFLSRTELMNFNGLQGNAAFDANSLGSVGTFSRERNVPTYWLRGVASAPAAPLTTRFALTDFGNLADPAKSGLVSVTAPNRWRFVASTITPPAATGANLFQLIHYARTTRTSTPSMAETLAIGAAMIDQHDADTRTTEIEYPGATPTTLAVAHGMEASDTSRPAAAPPPPSPYAMLNQPFRNVGELGYAYSAATSASQQTVNFASAGADAPILDFFTYNTAALRAGQVNLNTQNDKAVAAIIRGVWASTAQGSGVSATNAASAATAFVNASRASPAVGREDIPRLVTQVGSILGASDEAKEALTRAFAEVSTTRTWGLLIDVIAQSGRCRDGSSSPADFIVEGEKRYWLHVAIDRFTGEVIDQQLEAVYE